jgi:O-methyltransferase involved in polyketide biosynthesis
MKLPVQLRWVEADLPELVDQKERELGGEKPVCDLVRERVDLADEAARDRFLAGALEGARRALVITEGLLVYLEPAAVMALARALAKPASIAWWITDVASPGLLRMMQKETGASLGPSAQMKFGPEDGVRFCEPIGWKAKDVRSLLKEAGRLHRLPPVLRFFSFLPDAKPERPGNRPWSAVVRYSKA